MEGADVTQREILSRMTVVDNTSYRSAYAVQAENSDVATTANLLRILKLLQRRRD